MAWNAIKPSPWRPLDGVFRAATTGINRLRRYDARRRLSAQDDEAGPSMRIEKAEVIVTSPDRNFVTLRLETDDGVVGLGTAP